MTTDTDVLVVGGGVSGLATAWWLARAGLSVEIWEAEARAGGKIESRRQNGYLTERAAALLMNFRPEVVELVQEAGLEGEKISRSVVAESRRYLLHKGRLQALPMRLGSMIASPVWSWRGKLRLLAEPFIPAGADENESVSEFIARRLGREMLERAMEPFIAGTLAADPDRTCAAAALPRLTALERRYGSLAAGILVHRLLRRRSACRADTFSFRDGMETLVNNLAATPGVCLRTRHRIMTIERRREGWEAVASTARGERRIRAQELVLATPAAAAASLVRGLDTELSGLLAGIRYAPVSVVHLGFDRGAVKHALDGTGFLVPRGERLALTGNLWMSSLFAGRAPAGKLLLTAYLGGCREPGVAGWSDDGTIDEALDALRRVLGLRGEPEFAALDRHAEALPLYHGAYPARLRAMDERLARLPGLHLEANYRGGVSVRDRIARGRAVAQRILERTPPLRAGHDAPADFAPLKAR